MNNFEQKVGAFYSEGQTHFTVWAPLKKSVQLILLQPEKKKYPMTRDQWGYWHTSVISKPGNKYLYSIDNSLERPDPASVSQPDGVHGSSEVIDRQFLWEDDLWKGLPVQNMIIYELHVGAFSPSHNFKGIEERLDYLKQLGINTIEIMPVAQFPGDRNWGYDGVYPFAVQNSYGGAQGLKHLINIAHQKELAVMLDVVYNHLGPEGNYLPDYAPYFTDKYKTPWGKAINYDDAYCDGVRNYFLQNALMWLEEFHADGLRLDAVHSIWDNSAHHFIAELTRKVSALEQRTGCHKILIAEIDLNNPRYIDQTEDGGYALDAQWNDEFHHAVHSLLTGEKNGYYEDFGTLHHVEKAFRDTYVYNGNYSSHRKKLFGRNCSQHPFSQFVIFIQNHDQTGNRMLGERLTSLLSFEQLKLAATAYLLSPYIPLIFMGEEYGENNPFRFFVSHTDNKLIEMVRKGRKEEFAHFNWEGDVPDPQSADTFNKSTLSWKIEEGKNSGVLFSLYQYLLQFRRSNAAMQSDNRNDMRIYTEENILFMERKSAEHILFVALHFGNSSTTFNHPFGYLCKQVFYSADQKWNGPAAILTNDILPDQAISMAPFSAAIFEKLNI